MARRRLKGGERLRVTVPAAAPAEPQAETIPLAIVYEDDDLIVIDKPAGLVVHPGAGHETGTLVNALIAHCGDSLSGIGGVRRPGIVHRLDKDTSGLLVVAKNDRGPSRPVASSSPPMAAMAGCERAYLALVWGVPERNRGTIAAGSAAAAPTARRWRSSRSARRRAKPSPTMRCSRRFGNAARWRACSAACWKPAAPTRSACTWRISAIRCWAIRPMARASRPRAAPYLKPQETRLTH